MDNNPIQTTSFIPQKPLVPKSDFSASAAGIFLFLSIVVLIFSVAGYFIVLRQEATKNEDVKNLEIRLKKAQAQFQPNQVINMTRFDTKLKIAEDLLYLDKGSGSIDTSGHITLQPLFKLISDKTLKSVRFRDFKYSNIDNQKIEIRMNGEAKGSGGIANYAAVAQQAKEFADSRVLTNVIVSDLNLGPSGNVVFNLSASAKPELISYAGYLENLEQ